MYRAQVERLGSISRLVFGCSAVGGRVSERTALRAMAAAFEAGISTFDVARSYGYGEAELILGKFLAGRRQRSEIVTKAGILGPRQTRFIRTAKAVARGLFGVIPRARGFARPGLGAQHSTGHFAPDELEASLVASLRAMRTDYVDALLLHACTPEVIERDDVMEAMHGFVRRGLARRVGVAAGASEAQLWLARGGDPTAEFPASSFTLFPQNTRAGALWLANQPLGGGALLGRVQTELRSRDVDPEYGLELLLHRPLQAGAHGVVLSMVSKNHSGKAIRALTSPRLLDKERVALGSILKGLA